MRILWIINGLTISQQKKRNLSTPTISSWVEALIDNLSVLQYNFDIAFPIYLGNTEEFVEKEIKYIPFLMDKGLEIKEKFDMEQYRVVHIWGGEYSYTSKIIQLLSDNKMLNRTILSMQGICEYVGLHYLDGLPQKVIKRRTIRDIFKRDGIIFQKKMFLEKGKEEQKNLRKLKYVSGRTSFDRQYVNRTCSKITYYYCAEALREEFYRGKWEQSNCKKNRIFVSQGYYSIKGLHIALEALEYLKKGNPNIEMVVAGLKPFSEKKYRDSSYGRYIRTLIKKYDLEQSVVFLGTLSQEEMVQEYLKCNVFLMPSVIENSPNSICEAMVLGVPIVAAFVGGIPDLIEHGKNGFLYQWNAPYMLASYIKMLLENDELCEKIGECARKAALRRHGVLQVMSRWGEIYEDIDSRQRKE